VDGIAMQPKRIWKGHAMIQARCQSMSTVSSGKQLKKDRTLEIQPMLKNGVVNDTRRQCRMNCSLAVGRR
jgi:hypothetical protein